MPTRRSARCSDSARSMESRRHDLRVRRQCARGLDRRPGFKPPLDPNGWPGRIIRRVASSAAALAAARERKKALRMSRIRLISDRRRRILLLVTHRALVLALIASLLWPWAAAATCTQYAATVSECCTSRCCCEGESEVSCGCCAQQAPIEAPARAPPSASTAIDLVLDLAPIIDLRVSSASISTQVSLASTRVACAEGGRAMLRRGCRLRH